MTAPGCTARHGHVIVIPSAHVGWRVWGNEVFSDMAAANVTAARCVSGPCDILPAREIVHYAGRPGSIKYRRSILVDWASMGNVTQ